MTDQGQQPKKRGRKPQYQQLTHYQDGAPRLTTRIDPDKLKWVKSRPEGTRPYLERIIGEDIDRTQRTDQAGPSADSTSPADLPGQLLLTETVGAGEERTPTNGPTRRNKKAVK